MRRTPAETVEHVIYPVAEVAEGGSCCCNCWSGSNYDSVIVFCRTKHRADHIANSAQAQQSCRGGAAFQSHATGAGGGLARIPAADATRRWWRRTSPRAAWTLPTSAT